MKPILRASMAAIAVVLAGQAAADATFYEHREYQGRTFATREPVPDFNQTDIGQTASSVVITNRAWQLCDQPNFRGNCIELQPGNYPSLRDSGMNNRVASARGIRNEPPAPPPPPPVPPIRNDGSITLYEHNGFHGRTFSTRDSVDDLRRYGFNDRASSIQVTGERWMVCDDVNFHGRCVTLRPGMYPSLAAMGLNDAVSSLREVYEAPAPLPMGDWHPRPQERIYDVQVSDVRAVYGTPQQRCWVERRQVAQPAVDPNAALVGGLIGGILGHELSGRGDRTVGTVGGAVAGAAVGSAVSTNGGYAVVGTENVRRCDTVPNRGAPEYWDVVYVYRGAEHHVQMTTPPGPTIRVNENGEPRN